MVRTCTEHGGAPRSPPAPHSAAALSLPAPPPASGSAFWGPQRVDGDPTVCAGKHGAEMSPCIKIFPADFTGFQLPPPSLHMPTLHTHTHPSQTVQPFVCVGGSCRITFLKEPIEFIMQCPIDLRMANSQGQRSDEKGRMKAI